MDPRLRKRILIFNLAGAFNAVLGLYVLIKGPTFLPAGTVLILVLFFFAFAAVDFWFPYAMKKKWREEQSRLAAAQQQAAERKPEG
jgi:hypothetical protein